MPAAATPDSILMELAELWVTLGKSGEGEPAAGVLRACSLTLLVVTDAEAESAELGETLAALNPEHPSRAILIRLRPSAGLLLEARVLAQCWMPFGQRRQICSEQIEISVSDASLPSIPALVLPLLAPDLPVVLWCRSTRALSLDSFPRLAAMAGKLIVDSEQLDGAASALSTVAELARPRLRAADLAWTRLTRWRELVAQIFENRAHLAALPGIREVQVSHSGAQAPAGAWYLGAWLLAGIRAAGGSAVLRIAGGSAAPAAGITGVELLAGAGGPRFSIALSHEQVAEIRAGAMAQCAAFPNATEYLLMREELSIAGRDSVFETTLAAAADLARLSSSP
jgi:glucose-6-phosphate dehydrogenase assembly protein OpcA